MVFPDVDSRISDFTLKARGRGETKWGIVVDVETPVKVDDQVSLVIRFHGDGAIGTLHI